MHAPYARSYRNINTRSPLAPLTVFLAFTAVLAWASLSHAEDLAPVKPTDLEIAALRLEANLYSDDSCHLDEDDEEFLTAPAPGKSNPCQDKDREIVYLRAQRSIYLCSNGKVAKGFRAAIGSNGIGKQSEGDRKTPLGTYWLGAPRRSYDYGVFIPVLFPNEADKAAGRTGSNIGIHGPTRFSACWPSWNIKKDWTAGCTALGKDSHILFTANWALKNWPVKVHFIDNRKNNAARSN